MHNRLGISILLLLWGIVSTGHAVIIDRILAKVNDEIITLSQVQEEGYPLLARLQAEFSGKELEARRQQIEEKMLQQLIDRVLQLQQARKLGLSVSEAEVDAALQDILRRNNLTEEELKSILQEEDIDFLDYRQRIEEQLLLAQLLNREVRSKVHVDEEEVEEYYRTHLDQFGSPTRFRIRHILFLVPPQASNGEVEATRKKAIAVLQRIQAGEDFSQLARQYSQDPSAANGGDLGYLKKGEMLPAFEQALAHMRVGEVRGPIRTPYGFHLIRLEEKQGGEEHPPDAVRREIEKILINQKMQKRYQKWMEELRSEAYIEIIR
ncbi:MAG: hypothetical protein D6736_10710 [Nitrospinota bacterium]|nr:MAG: hypothetical protein D6736_10710 [Nitrospinota bacterium]